jgi:hypothetical protein
MNARVLLLPAAVVAVGGILWIAFPARAPGTAPAGPAGPAPPPARKAPDARRFHPEPVRPTTLPKTEKVPCVARGPKPVPLYAPVAKTPVETIHVRPGQAVRKGDPLVTFLDAGWKRALEAARKAGKPEEIAAAEKALASLVLASPADGVVHSVDARHGEIPLVSTIHGPTPVATLFDAAALSLEGSAPGELAPFLAVGAVMPASTPGARPFPVRIESLGAPGPDGTLPFVARPLEPPEVAPDPGGPATLEVVTGKQEALVVPRAALRQEEGRTVVHVIPVQGEPVPRPVVVGLPVAGDRVAVTNVRLGESVAVWE